MTTLSVERNLLFALSFFWEMKIIITMGEKSESFEGW